MTNYHGIFGNWQDVCNEFDMNEKEPDKVYHASYDYEDYEGNATVIYRNSDKYFYVRGGHCSCNGLEGQWQPEECTKQEIIGLLDRNHDDYTDVIKKILNEEEI